LIPVPDKDACCGLLGSLSATLRVPNREPVAPGVNTTPIVQELPVTRDVPHVPPLRVKSLPFAPIKVTTMLVTVTPVVFESVKITAELGIPTMTEPKLLLAGARLTDPMTYAAEPTELSLNPDLLPIASRVKEKETDTAAEYVVPCVHVPAPFAVGVVPSVV